VVVQRKTTVQHVHRKALEREFARPVVEPGKFTTPTVRKLARIVVERPEMIVGLVIQWEQEKHYVKFVKERVSLLAVNDF
jgi:hypothetical protein